MSILFNGFVLGWSVAWPPGPVNAEMIRRGLLPREQGGGFWETWRVGLGACTGDFVWAFAVAAGAGALLNNPGVRIILGIISLVLLVVLAVIFSRAAWKTARRHKELGRVARLATRHAAQRRLLARIPLCLVESVEHWILARSGGQSADGHGDAIVLELTDPCICRGPRCAYMDDCALRRRPLGCANFRAADLAGLDPGADRGSDAVFRSETCFATLHVRRFRIMPEREKTLTVNEIYHSIQGESTWAGRPCVFVRLTFCDLRCNYCDTDYAFYEGKKQTLKEIADAVETFGCPLVEITGGEPLLQKNVLPLMSMLADAGHTVLLETSGAHDISKVDPRVHRIMDLKTPGSGEVEKNLWSNIDHLTLRDEVKFVMGSREDYEWSRDKVQRYNLPSRCHAVLFSPIFGRIDPRQIVEWILADKLDVRFQLQMHKFIWSPTQRGV